MLKFLVSKLLENKCMLLEAFTKSITKKIIQITFGTGIYLGVYISQNYEIPRVDEPSKIIEKLKEFADDHKKK